ncbi:hypothetical protein SEUBUCD646_0N01860 [Saccharomyces eubayanus]|uniref:Chromatin modification-related protein EAF7 n=1 Tax=Saccharomyces eubayanus TaxID=1080349 RepID=A0ABN8VJH0_SACEU|nr:hypothetical protein SEUBUCD650_0N01860 [Saccharomyces eubayanus]CAI1711179.1 hypothetical protein SEUBUCD646_0N01860 [Saccharomyces eubayanus]
MAVHWTIVDEIRLLRWASEFKPAGIHKHFHMFCIVERMNSPDKYPVTLLQKETMKLGKVFTATDIWEKLSQSYNLKDIDKRETTFPIATTTDSATNDNDYDDNDKSIHEETLLELNNRIRTRKQDFTLPWDEYGELILENAKKSPTPNEEETQIEPSNDTNGQTPKKTAESPKKTVKKEENKDVEGGKVGDLKESNTNENNSPTPDSKNESMQGLPDDGKDKKTEHSSDEEQKMKNESKAAAPIRKSQRLKRNKEVKFEDEGREEAGEEKEQEEDEGLVKEDYDKAIEEEGEECNGNEEENDEREKSSSSETTNGSESEEADETLESDSDHEREDTEKDLGAKPDSERDTLKRKIENKNEESTQDGEKKNSKAQDEPLARRTRHSSSAGNTSNETSPKRQRRKAGSRKNRTPATRVSSRLRNKK